MALYKIGDTTIQPGQAGFMELVEAAYQQKIRPECMCHRPSPPMYIAHVGEQYIVKRMPNSGVNHAPDCDSFETPTELSGFGDVDGSAIQRIENNRISLRFDFALSRNGSQIKPGEPREKTSAVSSGKRLTLRGTLHYLWEEARLNRWFPAMAGRRNWFVIQKHLMLAADAKEAKRAPLKTLLYIPEFFDSERKAEIRQRRLARLAPIAQSGGKQLMLLIAEVSKIEKGRFGYVLIAKHLPDFTFSMSEDLNKSYEKIFAKVLGLWNFVQNSHLVAIATFAMTPAGTPEIQEISTMLTTANWLPIENSYDNELIELLTEQKRSFVKTLRYNLSKEEPIATAMLTDVQPEGCALYISLGQLDKDGPTPEMVEELMSSSLYPSWLWEPALGIPPELPSSTKISPLR